MARVLVVDDDENVRRNIYELLNSSGHEAIMAASGREALDTVKGQEFDIIMLDIIMPHLHGIDVLRKLREQDKNLPVVMLVSDKEKFLASRAVGLGAFDLLMKPVEKEKLFECLLRVLELKKKAQAKDESFDRIRALESGTRRFADIAKETLSLASLLEHTEILQGTVDLVAEVLNVEKVSLMLINRFTNEMKLAVAHGYDISVAKNEVKKVGEGISGWVAEKGEPLLVRDISKDQRFKESGFSSRYKSRSFISAPLKVFGETVGVISLNDKKNKEEFNEHDLSLLNMFSHQISLSLERSHVGSELKRHTESLSLVNETLRILITEVDPHSAFIELLRLTYNVLEAEAIALYFKEEDSEEFLTEAGIIEGRLLEGKKKLGQGKSICRTVIEEGNILYAESVSNEVLFNDRIDGFEGINVSSMIVLPIKSRDLVFGILKILNKRDGTKFTPQDIEITESIGFALSIEAKIAWLHNNLVKSIDELAKAETEIDIMRESLERVK